MIRNLKRLEKYKKTIEYENNFFPLEELGPNDEIVDGNLCSENI